jgi:hypothetical protein
MTDTAELRAELDEVKERLRVLEDMVVGNVCPTGHIPLNEAQCRELARLSPEEERQQLWADRIQFVMTHGGGRGQLSYRWFCDTFQCGDPADVCRWLNYSGNCRGIAPGSAIDIAIRRGLRQEREELLAITSSRTGSGVLGAAIR